MSSKPNEGTLKRPRISTASNISARRPAKRKKGLGNDNNSDKDATSSDSDCPILLRSPENDFENLAGPRDNSGHLSALGTGALNRREKNIRRSKSTSSLVSRGRGGIVQKRLAPSILRGAEDPLSEDEIDILGEKKRSGKLPQEFRGRHRSIELPIAAIEQRLIQTTPSDISDELIERTGDVPESLINRAFIGNEVSQSDSTVDEDSKGPSAQILTTEDGDDSSPSEDSTESSEVHGSSMDDTLSPEDVSDNYEPSKEIENASSPERARNTKKIKKGRRKSILEVKDNPPTNAAANQGTKKEGKNEEEFKTALRELVQKLGISNEAVISIFKKLGISLSMDRIEIASRTGGDETREPKYYSASTVTRELLETHGSWEFENEFDWKIIVEPIPASEIYQPLSMDGVLLDINESPIRVHGPEQPCMKLHVQILRALRGVKDRLESIELKLQLPRDWGSEENLLVKLNSNLELPKAYENALKEGTAASTTEPQEVEDYAASVSNDVDLRKMEKHPKQRGRQTTPESPLPGLIRDGIDDSPGIPSPPPRYGSVDFGSVPLSVVQRLILDNGLQPTVDGARRLQSLLALEKAKISHRQSLKTLCQRLHTADERDFYQGTDADQGAELFGSGTPYPTIEYVPRETIETRDKIERSGNAAINEDAQDAKYGAAKRVLQWMDFGPVPKLSANRDKAGNAEPDSERSTRSNTDQKKRDSTNKDLTEVMVEERCGILVKGMFWGHKHAKETENKMLKFLQCLHLFGTNPRADYAVRLSGQEWQEWGALMAVCLLSGECKVSSEITPHTEAQLAMNSVPALTMFILLHLSTRTTADQLLPPWMWKFAFVYTEKGVTIYAHFPKLVVTDAGEARWKFVSLKVSDKFAGMWVEGQKDELRMQGLAVFDMMRSHTESLLEQLLAWSKNLPESAIPIMDTLIAKARLEMEDYEWLKKKAQEKEEKREQGAGTE